MRSDAKASTAGSTQRQASGLGRFFRGAGAGRAPSPRAAGSGAPSRRLFFSLPLALLFAALFYASAQAAPTTIAEWGHGAGQVNLPRGTAVDRSTGDLYVAERNNFRVSKFDSAGNFLLAFGYGVADGTTHALQTCGPEASPPTTRCFAPNFYPLAISAETVAVDQSTGDVYVSDNWRVSKFTPSGQLVFMVGRNVNKTKAAEGGATQAEKDFCSATSGDECGNGASGTAANEFSGQGLPLAVDSSGAVWVGDKNRLISFDSAGAPGAEIALSGTGSNISLALDSAGDFYVKSASLAGIRKLEAGTGTLLETLDAANNPRTVTVDGTDNVYIGHCVTTQFGCGSNPYRFDVFNSAGEKISQFGAGQVIGGPEGNAIAVGEGAERLYAASARSSEDNSVVQAFPLPEPGPLPENEHVAELEPATATLAAELNPEGHETTYHFEWGTSESYGESGPTETLGVEEFDPEAVSEELEELIPSTTYHFRLCATNEKGTVCGADTTFTTLPAVAIDAQWASEVAAHSATLNAELNPLGIAGHWWIEYGTSAAYGSQTAHEALLASFGDMTVSSTLTGLAPNTTYHYRFVATDVRDGTPYTVHGSDLSFTTQLSGLGFSLADNRAWEMVSPPKKYGGRILIPTEEHLQAAADGDALAYLSRFSVNAYPDGNRAPEDSSALARRGPDGSWSSQDITPPNTRIGSLLSGFGGAYKLFSSELSSAVVDSPSNSLLSPQASEPTLYLRENADPPTYTPLVTGKEGFANVLDGTEFGGRLTFQGATPDLRHVVFSTEVPLVEGVTGGALYEWTAGRLTPVSVKPEAEGGSAASATFGSGAASTRKAISDDGSRVFWTGGGLYLRDLAREETVRLDTVQPGAFGTGAEAPVFQGANAAGTVAFFTDTQNLTEDANESGADLYRCEVTVEGGELGCDLTDITANGAESAEVQGVVPGMSDNATEVYLVARGVLDASPDSRGDRATPGQPNLYLWRQGSGVRFITTLSEADSHDWGPDAASLSATASPSGHYLAFMSERSLTGYDNHDAVNGELDREVFRYDAASESLVCASCDPSGARPVGLRGFVPSESLPPAFDPQGIWDGVSLAADLPEARKLESASVYRPRVMHDDGRVFFNAADSLVPADSNGAWDVYQYESSGMGTCSPSSGGAATSVSSGGCVSLISSGTGSEESAFVDAGEGGDDAFFLTSAQLSVTDEDRDVDIYDARVGGIPATLTPHPECQGEACQPPVSPPSDKTPASATFKGSGNLRYRPDCGAIARRTGKLSHRARRLRRHAKHAHNPTARRRMAREAKRLAHRAHALGVRAKRCRRANRRAGR